ncbi:glycosyltransferase family 4 protein [Bacillus sp. CH126_4D]|uniref:glycosyltransferase family 4 protein n=1 Tax=unclassified Bacillus (in: firmicutes) TaxID=185979 RepID=UPI00124D5760|nr:MULTISPECIES: glycosyltransferase family 4 protein [unclassified Bacillus (in: firmicutes)]KAB2460520.1 glycosyltransferase family 4 protein [Bacillus sp. CH140a_4T]KAB2468595.1 glycosyltransferase family 4 protein [Bacillus sp. CH126_4D]
MRRQEEGPYPYIVKALDEYFGVNSFVNNKKEIVKLKQKSKNIRQRKIKSRKSKEKKLSILIATFWDYPHVGGLSNYIKTLSDGLKRLGHDVDIISPNQFSMNQVEMIRGEIVPALKRFFNTRYGNVSNMILKNNRNMYVYEKMLLENTNLKKYDIFHVQDLFTANILGKINERYGKPIVFTPHGMYTFNRLKFGIIEKGSVEEVYYKELEKKAIEYSHQLIILSDSFRKPLSQMGALKENIEKVLTGIDYPTVSRQKDNEKLVISCVSRLGPRKGHDILFNALSYIGNEYTDKLKVLIVGDGEMREERERQAVDLGLSMVEFLGKRDDIPNILAKTDVFVLPTINDSLPISIIEAMHYGICVISTKSGGIPELVANEKDGILVDVGDTNQLANAIKRVIDNKEEREMLGRNAKEFAKTNLTQESMAMKVEEVYKNICGRGKIT